MKFRRPQMSDTAVDIKTFIRMQEALESFINADFCAKDFLVSNTGILRVALRAPSISTASHISGTAYVAGIKTIGLNSDDTLPWVKCILSTGVAIQAAGPPSTNPFPSDEEWFLKSETYGDIHVSRA